MIMVLRGVYDYIPEIVPILGNEETVRTQLLIAPAMGEDGTDRANNIPANGHERDRA